MLRLFRNIKYLLIRIAGNSPALYLLLKLVPAWEELLVVKDTRICIEGFPRSANTFLVLFFSHWNPGLKAAHHLHLPIQVKMATKYKVPTVVVIRHPLDAISSLMVRESFLYTWVAIKSYILFYRMLNNQNFIFVNFEDCTKRPETIIALVNEKYGQHFKGEVLTEQVNEHLFKMIDRVNKINAKEETATSRPSKLKDSLKKQIIVNILHHRLYGPALKLYQDLV
jgi:hypothetical protein